MKRIDNYFLVIISSSNYTERIDKRDKVKHPDFRHPWGILLKVFDNVLTQEPGATCYNH
jgi:hypothetical protein